MLSNNFVLVARVAGRVSADQIREALRCIPLRHPVLAHEDPAAIFSLTVRADCSENDWIDLVRSELATPFPEGPGPKARFHLLALSGGFDFAGCFDHGLCEGKSGVFVFRDIFQAVAEPAAPIVAIPPQPELGAFISPALMKARAFRLKVALGIALVRGHLWAGKLRRRLLPRADEPVPAKPAGDDSAASREFIVLPALLTPAQTAGLMARCKSERVSLHAAVAAAWLYALVAETTAGSARRGLISSPVDLRQRFESGVAETSGRYMSLVETPLTYRPDQDFWAAARSFKTSFEKQIRPERLFFRPVIFQRIVSTFSVDDIRSLLMSVFGGPVKHDFSISNLGRTALPEQIGSLRPQALYGLVNASPGERTVVTCTLGGRMSFSFLFRASLMNAEVGRRLMDRAMRLLLDDPSVPAASNAAHAASEPAAH